MADNVYCTEDPNTCFDEFDCNATNNESESCSSLPHGIDQTHSQDLSFDSYGSQTLMGSVLESEERVRVMVEKEIGFLPGDDYLKRMLRGDLDLRVRKEAFDWIWKAHRHYSFGPLSLCLSMNYLDRFLSVYQLPMDKSWAVQLLSVSCLSLAAKMEEIEVPLSIDLQVGDPKFVFEAKTIQRMELLVLSTLKWKMQPITPFSFIDYFLSKITVGQQVSTLSLLKSTQLILRTIKGIDFLEFRPSEIALAVAVSISGELQAVDMDKAMASFPFMEKEKVMKCVDMMKELSLVNNNNGNSGNGSVPESPVGVLDAATCLSYKSEELSVSFAANSNPSSHNNSPDSKRRRPDQTRPETRHTIKKVDLSHTSPLRDTLEREREIR